MATLLDIAYSALDVKPLSARSVILSVLLGSHPPSLPAKELVALAVAFGFKHGTVRTAVSRMVANSELVLTGGDYLLGARLLKRQQTQDSGRRSVESAWNGEWTTVAVLAERRTVSERREFRSTMQEGLMGELRPDLWLRPDNVSPPEGDLDLMVTTGSLQGPDPLALVERLWPLRVYQTQTSKLIRAIRSTQGGLEQGDHNTIPNTFHISSEVVRFLRIEPRLPSELDPNAPHVGELRSAYDEYEKLFQAVLADFFQKAA